MVIYPIKCGIKVYVSFLQKFTNKGVKLVLAINAINSYSNPEYLRILQELRKLGIAPTGNLAVDKGKLEQAKTELINKIQNKQEEEQKQVLQAPVIEAVDSTEYAQRAEMEEQRLGAMTVAELNRLYFGI